MLFATLLIATTFASAPPTLEQDGDGAPRVISSHVWHLGNDPAEEWLEASATADAERIDIQFHALAFVGDGLLQCQQRHVNNAWHIEINGKRIATLDRTAPLADHLYEIPAGLIRDGSNTFSLVGDVPTDDITFGKIRYYPYSFRKMHDLLPVEVHVTDSNGAPLPARVTILDDAGDLAEVFYAEDYTTAVRQGVVYTSNGAARFEVPRGTYSIHAARGTEWSRAEARVAVIGKRHVAKLSLSREVDTTGFVAADTHIHTLTHSGHGDSSVEERMVTLAGEGVELAIATDHNHNTDYAPTQKAMGLEKYFTPVVGNEVTTPIGHLNGFPLNPKDEIPPHRLHDIVKIVEGIRAKGAEAVILNHPRWPSHQNSPHGDMHLDHATGDWIGHWACPFDAMELINSQTVELEPRLLFKDWFSLLNRGERIFAVGSSDSHTVGGVVGQGRTYVQSATDVAHAIDIHETSHNIADGHSSISMGIFIEANFKGRSVLGKTMPLAPVSLRIAAPSWVTPRTLTVFANGVPIMKQRLQKESDDAPYDRTITAPTDLPWPDHDFWMVALVEGDGVGSKAWPQLNDYTLAATNPVFFDIDGDGAYTHPRAMADRLMKGVSLEDTRAIAKVLATVDSAVGDQIRRLYHGAGLARAQKDADSLPAAVSEAALDGSSLLYEDIPADAEPPGHPLSDTNGTVQIELRGPTAWNQTAWKTAPGGHGDHDSSLARAETMGRSLVPGAAESATLDVMWIQRGSGPTAWDAILAPLGAANAPICAVVSADGHPGWLWVHVGPRSVDGLVVFANAAGEYALHLRADPAFTRPAAVLMNAAQSFRRSE